jgi:hypothetical protein
MIDAMPIQFTSPHDIRPEEFVWDTLQSPLICQEAVYLRFKDKDSSADTPVQKPLSIDL